jgi:hypothetical protein
MNRRGARNDDIVTLIVDYICQHEWQNIALIGLDVGKPFAFFGAQILWLFQPMLGVLLPPDLVGNIARLLEDPEAVMELTYRLESIDVVTGDS